MTKKEILLETIPFYQNNRYFQFEDPYLSPDNLLRPFYELKLHLAKKGYDFKTTDLSADPKSAYAIISLEIPREPNRPFFKLPILELKEKLYCFLYEPPSVRSDNYDKTKHGAYKKLFTWKDDLVDNKKYFKFQYYLPFFEKEKIEILKTPFKKRKLLTLISANKYSYHPDQLYKERIAAIRFMEKHHPNDFDLYGGGWDMPVLHSQFAEKYYINNFHKVLSKLKKALKIGSFGNWQYPSWKGRVEYKLPTMANYKFAICYENINNIKGYISEKIMDCFRAGTIPIYWGASNITDFVPKDCFIDRSKFSNYEELYDYISSINEEEYQKYIKNIQDYLNSRKSAAFKIDNLLKVFDEVLEI